MTEVVHVRSADPACPEPDPNHPGRERSERALDHAQILRSEERGGEDSLGHLATPIVRGSQSVNSGM